MECTVLWIVAPRRERGSDLTPFVGLHIPRLLILFHGVGQSIIEYDRISVMAQTMSGYNFASLMGLAYPTSLDEVSVDCRRYLHGVANCVHQFESSSSSLFMSAGMGN